MEPAPQRVVIDLPARTILRVIVLVLLAAAAVELLTAVHRILVWLATSLFLAVALQPAVRFAERRLSHTLAVFALGLVTLFASQYILPEDLYPWLGVVSGLMVVTIGLAVMRSR